MPCIARLVGAASVVAALLLSAGCTSGSDDEPSPPRTSSGKSGATASSTAAPEFPVVASREGYAGGHRIRLDVAPLTRAATATVLTAKFTVLQLGRRGSGFNPAGYFEDRGGAGLPSVHHLSGVRLFVPEEGVMARPARDASNQLLTSNLQPGVDLKQGESAGVQIVFGPLPAGTRRADVLWPLIGAVPRVSISDAENAPPVPPYGEGQGRAADPTAVADAEVRSMSPHFSELGGAVRTDQGQARTTVRLAADLFFAEESARLTTRSREGIARAAAQIRAAGEGPIRITGHTDDQGSALIGQQLSERRAKAVATAIARLLPPARYPPTVVGKGEREPAVPGTSDEARAANRRVEIEAQRAQMRGADPESQQPFPATGPTASGAEGLVLSQSDGSTVRIRAVSAERSAEWLRLDITIGLKKPDSDGTTDVLVDFRDPSRVSATRLDMSGVGVVDGQRVALPALDAEVGCTCPNNVFGLSMEQGEVRSLPIYVSAPVGSPSSVAVHLPGKLGQLTNIPVIQAPPGT